MDIGSSAGPIAAFCSAALRMRIAGALAAALVLAGCGGGQSGSAEPARSAVGQFLRGTTAEPTTLDPELFEEQVVCPQITILPGAEVLRRDGGNEVESELRYQATIVNTARECSKAPNGVAIRIGVSGRVLEGAAGAPDRVELPLRIAVREGEEVTYSRLHNVTVEMNGASEPWAFVENVTVGQPRSTRIAVGFDG